TAGAASAGIVNGGDGATITIGGGAISTTGDGSFGMLAYGNDGTVTISGGTISTTGASSFGVFSGGDESVLTMTGGAISTTGKGANGLEIQGGGNTAVISGGTISATGEDASAIFAFADDLETISLTIGTDARIVGNILGEGEGTIGLSLNGLGEGLLESDVIGLASLTKTESGRWTLNGDIIGGSDIVIEAGLLSINGQAGESLVQVASGATLGGTGTVGSTTVAAGGRLAAGNSIGTLTVAGTATFAAGSVLEVEVAAGEQSDLVAVAGVAQIDGGTVHVLRAQEVPETRERDLDGRYVILTAEDEVTGVFDAVTEEFAFLDASLAYDVSNVFLTLQFNGLDFSAFAGTPNQIAVANSLQDLGAGPTFDAVLGLNEDEVAGALDALSGEVHEAIHGVLIHDSQLLRNAITARLAAAAFDAETGGTGSMTGTGTQAEFGVQAEAEVWGPDTAWQLPPLDAAGASMWIDAGGSVVARAGDGNGASYDQSGGSLLVGGDMMVEDWHLGLVGGYGETSFAVDDRASSGDAESYHAGVYGGRQWGALALRTGLGYSRHRLDIERSVGFYGLDETLSSDYAARSLQAFGEVGYRLDMGEAVLEPFLGLSHVRLSSDGFTEEGGPSALTVAAQDHTVNYSTLGLRGEHDVMLQGMAVRAKGKIAWMHAFGDTTPQGVHNFAGGDAFTIASAPIASDIAVLEAGFDVRLNDTSTLGFSYSGQIGDGGSRHAVNGTFAVRF
ncbi:outer membrane autotransporter barrel domain protein, partial [Rhizobium sp. PDO1-076]|uniref:autotransporter family protein n=1 Tax=Rhizobium sp. PDO1-076 TaxID=1125979 RepID=UPI00024E3B21